MIKRFIAMMLSIIAMPVLAANCQHPVNPCDPYEAYNRGAFQFNEFLDCTVLKPMAELYNKIIPKPVAKGINNFFANIDTIPTIANDLLQANFYQATSDTWRLGLNSTVGILGFFDVASCVGLEPNHEDLGLTFAHWGWTDSAYVVIPFLGPSTWRDGLAWPINYEFLTIYPYINPPSTRYALFYFGYLDTRAQLLRFQSVLEQAALDRYVFVRDAYMQHRKYQIERNRELNNPYLEKNPSECAHKHAGCVG